METNYTNEGGTLINYRSFNVRREDAWKAANDEQMKSHFQLLYKSEMNLFKCFAEKDTCLFRDYL